MPEPITTVTIGAVGAYLAKDGVAKLLGPTAAYLGDGLQQLVEKRADNLVRIFKSAENHLGDEINQPGQVPPRILKSVINEGTFIDDSLAIEYYGGLLASSRTLDPDEDRGVAIAKSLENMSVYQIRAHYIFYGSIGRAYQNKPINLSTSEGRKASYTGLNFEGFCKAMGLEQDPNSTELRSIMEHIMFGLSRMNMIRSPFFYGTSEALSSKGFTLDEPKIMVAPSLPGAELFIWGIGEGLTPPSRFNHTQILKKVNPNVVAVIDAHPFDLPSELNNG